MTPHEPGKKAGDILLDEGLISPSDVSQVLAIQERNQAGQDRNRLFGMVLCDLNLVTPMDNYCALDKHGKLLSVGEYLVRKKLVPRAKLDALSLGAQKADVPFISYILDQGVLTKSKLQQILFDLFYIPFRSVSDIVFEKGARQVLAGIIGRETAEENRCIPLQLTGTTLMVGITDPANLIFLRDLDHAFPQYRFNPVFIPFSGFTWFYKLLYEKDWTGSDKRPVDLSYLMKSAIVIQDPELEAEKILTLFERYERVRKAASQGTGRGVPGREDQFLSFVAQHHERICTQYGCSRVAFSLKMDENRLMVLAMPEKEGPS